MSTVVGTGQVPLSRNSSDDGFVHVPSCSSGGAPGSLAEIAHSADPSDPLTENIKEIGLEGILDPF